MVSEMYCFRAAVLCKECREQLSEIFHTASPFITILDFVQGTSDQKYINNKNVTC